MKHQLTRVCLVLALSAAAGFALWSWFRPYAWQPDPGARCQVIQTLVTRDQNYYWLEIRLKMNPNSKHDLQQKVTLETASHKNLEPADSTLRGDELSEVTDLWFKFWLEPTDLEDSLTLHINDGTLLIKSQSGKPSLEPSGHRTFNSNFW